MTRVALLGPSRHPGAEPFARGRESHVATLALLLRRRGHHVVLDAAPGSDPSLADELVTHQPRPGLSAVSALDPNLPEPGFLRDQHAFLSVVGDLMRRHDVDVVHDSPVHRLPRQPTVGASGVDVERFAAGPDGDDLAWVGRLDHAARPLLGPDVTYAGHLEPAAASVPVGPNGAVLATPRWEEPFGLVAAHDHIYREAVAAW